MKNAGLLGRLGFERAVYCCVGQRFPVKRQRISGLERGQGMFILRELARQKDGNLSVTSTNGVFRVVLLQKKKGELL